jgi:hypothetical protein
LQEQWRAEREEHDNPNGVPGVGSVAHCVHGKMKMTHEVVDWKPYRYYTYRSLIPILGRFLCTDEISPTDGARWNVAHRIRAIGGIRQRGALRLFGSKQKTETNKAMGKLERLLEEAAERSEPEPSR